MKIRVKKFINNKVIKGKSLSIPYSAQGMEVRPIETRLEMSLNFPQKDLFASHINTQLATYCSCRLGPGATFVDAFSISWADFHFYSSLHSVAYSKLLQKVQ